MSETTGQFLGVALIARRKCGRMAGLMWTDAYRHSEIEAKELEWKCLGFDVRREPRYERAPWPEPAYLCNPPCACKGEAE